MRNPEESRSRKQKQKQEEPGAPPFLKSTTVVVLGSGASLPFRTFGLSASALVRGASTHTLVMSSSRSANYKPR